MNEVPKCEYDNPKEFQVPGKSKISVNSDIFEISSYPLQILDEQPLVLCHIVSKGILFYVSARLQARMVHLLLGRRYFAG